MWNSLFASVIIVHVHCSAMIQRLRSPVRYDLNLVINCRSWRSHMCITLHPNQSTHLTSTRGLLLNFFPKLSYLGRMFHDRLQLGIRANYFTRLVLSLLSLRDSARAAKNKQFVIERKICCGTFFFSRKDFGNKLRDLKFAFCDFL